MTSMTPVPSDPWTLPAGPLSPPVSTICPQSSSPSAVPPLQSRLLCASRAHQLTRQILFTRQRPRRLPGRRPVAAAPGELGHVGGAWADRLDDRLLG